MLRIRMPVVYILALFVWIDLVPHAASTEQMTLYLNLLPHRLTGSSGRQYDLLLLEILDKIDQKPTLKAGPLIRTGYDFKNNSNACIFPSSPHPLQQRFKSETFKLLISVPLETVSLRLYLRKGVDPSTTLQDLNPQRVGHILGSVAVKLNIESENQFKTIASEDQMIRMLELGRLDAFIGHHPDTVIAFDKMGKSDSMFVGSDFAKKFEFLVHFVCKETPQTALFLKGVNRVLLEMHRNGRIREILGPHAQIPGSEVLKGFNPDS